MTFNKFFTHFMLLVLLSSSLIARADTTTDSERIFDWAESTYPELFGPAAETMTLAPWYFRYYENTGIYIAINYEDEDVYVLGGFWGDGLRVGSMEEVMIMAGMHEEEEENIIPTLRQSVYKSGSSAYIYGYDNAIEHIVISGAPEDTDTSRWAMLHDGSAYRLYFFKKDSNDTLYQFGYNPATASYEYGYNSIATVKITNAPADADASSFAMLHDGQTYRLYLRSKANPEHIHQFAYRSDKQTYEYGYNNAIPVLELKKSPQDTDHSRWAMVHDGDAYRYYAFQVDSDDDIYQFAYNSSTQDYEYGYNSIADLSIEDMPDSADSESFAMLHDGSKYRLYFLDFTK